jgi:hypothetical protein
MFKEREAMSPFRPDYSDFLAHFTTDRAPYAVEDDNPAAHVAGMNAQERLITILNGRKVIASKLPWKNGNAVCLTECPWGSLIDHARRYSPYGIGFHKAFIFGTGGGPVYYVRGDHYQNQNWDQNVHTFVTPFWPFYRPKKLRTSEILGNKNIDYSHEREWRVPHDLTFQYNHIKFVVLNTYEDMAKFPKELKDTIGREKFLLMENYKQIERIWPVHNI